MGKSYLDGAPDPMGQIAPTAREIFLAEQGRITHIAGFRVTPMGLVAEREMNKGEWEEMGVGLRQLSDGLHWIVGDWMAYGERRWKGTYEDMEMATGFAVKTLYNDSYVARKFEISRRREKLSIAQHAEVASVSEPWQEVLLDYVEERTLTRGKLRKLVAALRDDGGEDDFQHENPHSAKPPWARDMFHWFDLILEELAMDAKTGVIPEATVLDDETVRRLDWLIHLTHKDAAQMGLEDLDQAEEIILDSQDYLNTLWETVSARRSVLAAGGQPTMIATSIEVAGTGTPVSEEEGAYDTLA